VVKNGRVVILGGGVAGMTAAQELAERGFAVTVLEKRRVPGGKARSTEVERSATGARAPLPGEHGFRFFPGFYRHLPDSFARIPDGRGKTVLDHLVAVHTMTFAFGDRPPFVLPARFPRSLEEVGYVLGFFEGMGQMGITVDDLVFTWWKLWQVLTSSKKRRLAELEPLGWWRFMDADAQSEPFRRLLVIGLTRNLVASRAEEANARTVAQVGIQLLLDLVRPGDGTDRILDGPTNDVWIEPWLAKLRADGVDYRAGVEVERIELNPLTRRVTSIAIRASRDATSGSTATDAPPERIEGDDFVLALPVEVVASFLRRQPELLTAAPRLAGIVTLGEEQVEWMNGIQFYLTERVDIARGHVNLVDSPWALTAIAHSQFWPDYPAEGFGDGSVKTVLSVDISAWDRPGTTVRKEAWDCTFDEIGKECFAQLKAALNHDREVLRDDMLHATHPFNLDDDIAEREDKEQRRPPGGRRRGPRRTDTVDHNGKPDLLTNAEPLLVNVEDSWKLRPKVTTEIGNLFLASDYVQTVTNLATMEAANEAARRATNAILLRRGASAPRAKVFPLKEPFDSLRARDALRVRRGETWKNPFWVDWVVKVTLVAGASVIRVVAWFAALPRPLYPIMLGYVALMWLFARNLDSAYGFAFDRVCRFFDVADLAAPAACALPVAGAPSDPARATFFYAGYMLLFGASVYVMPRSVLSRLGFPRERGPWIPVLGATPVVIATFYLFAALFEVREFFWLSVLGRTCVFLYVLWITFGRGLGTTLLLLMALPDFATALWSAWLLAPSDGAAALLCLGIVNLAIATTFRLFSARLLRALGFPTTPNAWVPMVAVLLWFWGAYEVLVSLLELRALFAAAALCHCAFGLLCLVAPFVYAERQGPFARGYRLWFLGAAYFASGAWTFHVLRA
jgi:15-cis-phytoene desaturase